MSKIPESFTIAGVYFRFMAPRAVRNTVLSTYLLTELPHPNSLLNQELTRRSAAIQTPCARYMHIADCRATFAIGKSLRVTENLEEAR